MITFEKVRWKNLLSTGNFFTEINLTRSPNTLIIGNNGSGKSTILDALTFGLFGKPYRKINKPQLLNSINGKDCLVEVEFSIGNKNYKVVRGIKPNVFEIYVDGKMINQDAASRDYQEVLEKSILKLNYKSFTQIVILGSASFTPFMQLSASDRRAIIEDLLDIQIFSSMNTLLKQKVVQIKDAAIQLKYDLDLTEEKIKMKLQHLEENEKNKEEEITVKQKELKENESHIIELQSEIETIQKTIDELMQDISDKTSVESKNKKLIQLESKIENNIQKIEKDIEFYHDNDNCPTCRQNIEEEFKVNQIKERESKVEEQKKGLDQIKEEIKVIDARIEEIIKITKDINQQNSEIVKHNSSIFAINKYITKLNDEIKILSLKKISSVDEDEQLKELNLKLEQLKDKQKELSSEKQYYDFATNLLKDTGIKTKIIKQYLPIINKLINKYLTSMDSFINFNLNESFEETIKSRHRDDFSYHNFSEGEKMRIDLAILFTWRQIAKLKNSTNTNLLILDEVFDSSLDVGGTEEFLKLMYDIGNDTNVFVISHKGDQLFDKFRSVIRFEKKNNFSGIA
jgi:DNA repair exonuclease SbcCD ATPase subunit